MKASEIPDWHRQQNPDKWQDDANAESGNVASQLSEKTHLCRGDSRDVCDLYFVW